MIDYKFVILVTEDENTPLTYEYKNALEAVNAFNMYQDYGSAKKHRSVTLREPDGTMHRKSFIHKHVQRPPIKILSSIIRAR